jgi:hypothetical protein
VNPEEADVHEWLAAATGSDPEDVSRELAEGERRRIFVADELIDAGFSGGALLDGVMRLTGLDEAGAQRLIASRSEGIQ